MATWNDIPLELKTLIADYYFEGLLDDAKQAISEGLSGRYEGLGTVTLRWDGSTDGIMFTMRSQTDKFLMICPELKSYITKRYRNSGAESRRLWKSSAAFKASRRRFPNIARRTAREFMESSKAHRQAEIARRKADIAFRLERYVRLKGRPKVERRTSSRLAQRK